MWGGQEGRGTHRGWSRGMKAIRQKEEGNRRQSSREKESNRAVSQGRGKEWRVMK